VDIHKFRDQAGRRKKTLYIMFKPGFAVLIERGTCEQAIWIGTWYLKEYEIKKKTKNIQSRTCRSQNEWIDELPPSKTGKGRGNVECRESTSRERRGIKLL